MAKLPGSCWIEGEDFHYIDSNAQEWYIKGKTPVYVSNAIPGSVWIDETSGIPKLAYIDQYQYRRVITNNLVGSGYGISGSLWIETPDAYSAFLHWVSSFPKEYYGHDDVAAHNNHSDIPAHSDHVNIPSHTNIHSDTAAHNDHSDTAGHDDHTNSYSNHYDGHGDHNDFVYVNSTGHSDATSHDDHTNIAYINGGPHSNYSYVNGGAHNNVDAHNDGTTTVHTDGGAHVNVDHDDQPVLLGT